MSGYSVNLEAKTQKNSYFREVLYTTPHSQLVVMSLKSGEEIGMETHDKGDQFIRVEEGEGEAIIDGQRYPLADGVAVVIPAGAKHNIVNKSSTKPMKLYTVYSPAEHADGTIHKTKAEAEAAEHHHHG